MSKLRLTVAISLAPSQVSVKIVGQPRTETWAEPELEADVDNRRITRVGYLRLGPQGHTTDVCRPLDGDQLTDADCLEMILRHLLGVVVAQARWPLWGLRLKPDLSVETWREMSATEVEFLQTVGAHLGARRTEVSRWTARERTS